MYRRSNFSSLSKLQQLPYALLGCLLLLQCLGIVLLISASSGDFYDLPFKQAITVLIGIPVMLVIGLIPQNVLYHYSYHIYFATLLLLFIAELMGHTAMGAQRWLRFGALNVQPAEFAKLGVILALARYYNKLHFSQVKSLKSLIIPVFIIILPAALILKQPNLGSAIILIMIGGLMLFAAGVMIWKFVCVFVVGLCACPFIWHFLYPYQKQRIMTFLNPQSDPLGAGYNIIQSKIAIGSGGILGKGFIAGTQTQLSFLPEKHTDFIFTILAEEFGFLGCSVALLIYCVLLILGVAFSMRLSQHFGRLIIAGVSAMLFVHIVINISMISGIIPVVGTPLPFLSYGRSNLFAMILGYGLVVNAVMNVNGRQLK